MIFQEQLSRKPDHYPWAQEFIEAEKRVLNDKSSVLPAIYRTLMLIYHPKNMIIRTLSAIGQINLLKKFWSKLGDNLPHLMTT